MRSHVNMEEWVTARSWDNYSVISIEKEKWVLSGFSGRKMRLVSSDS